jgi:hypothetical protein
MKANVRHFCLTKILIEYKLILRIIKYNSIELIISFKMISFVKPTKSLVRSII